MISVEDQIADTVFIQVGSEITISPLLRYGLKRFIFVYSRIFRRH